MSKTVEDRKREAAARKVARGQRAAADQLLELDHRLGSGVGAAKERARLLAQIDAQIEAQEVARKAALKSKKKRAA